MLTPDKSEIHSLLHYDKTQINYKFRQFSLIILELRLGQEPEIFLPTCVNQVPTHTIALFPHTNRQTICTVDAPIHELL